jgi:serine/threonine-protein kinase
MLTSGAIVEMSPAPPPVPADADPLIGRVLDGRYRIRARLGQGGMGAVYEGEHVEIKKQVAIKVLRAAFERTDEFRKRFEREARAASRLSHPGCVSVLDFGRVQRIEPDEPSLLGIHYLVMEFVRGEPLIDRIAKGKLPPREAVAIARGLLAGLRHAHGLGIVHRDVKPANVMLASTGDASPLVKLLDFGLAKDLGAHESSVPLTQAGMVFGTPSYLSSEQALGQPADARSDLYSVGIVLFEMVCGTLPFVHKERIDVVRAHALTPAPKPTKHVPSLSPKLEEAILRALVKEPKERFQSAKEFEDALAACPEVSGARAPLPNPVPVPLPLMTRLFDLFRAHRRVALAAGAGLAVLVTILLIVTLRHSAPPAFVPSVSAPAAIPEAVAPLSPSARRHLALAADYERKLWCSDAIDELERALHDSPSLRNDRALVRTAIPCLRAKTQARTIRFLVESFGETARPELEAARAGALPADVREGVERALSQISR